MNTINLTIENSKAASAMARFNELRVAAERTWPVLKLAALNELLLRLQSETGADGDWFVTHFADGRLTLEIGYKFDLVLRVLEGSQELPRPRAESDVPSLAFS